MLFLLRGHHGPLVRAVAGALLLTAGIILPAAVFIAIGVVLIGWGAFGAVSTRRARPYRRSGPTGGRP